MHDDIGDLPEYDDSDLDKSGIETAAPTTVFGPFPTAEDVQKHGPFWELKSATGKTLRVKFEDGQVCQVKVQVALIALGDGYSAQSARRTFTVGAVPPSIMARPVISFDTLLGAAPFYLGSVVRCKTTGIPGFVIVADIHSSSADSLLSIFDAKYTYRIAWCEKHPASVSPIEEESLDFLGLPDKPLHTGDSAAQYLTSLQQFLRTVAPTTTESIYPLRGFCIGNHEVAGVTYRYDISTVKEAADKPWTADLTRTQEFTPAADGQTAAIILAHSLAFANNRPDSRVGYVRIKNFRHEWRKEE